MDKPEDQSSIIVKSSDYKEREREKRRLRDRQRRQSMTPEEKEEHLARRRKNYQLRRQKRQSLSITSTTTPEIAKQETTALPLPLLPDPRFASCEESPKSLPLNHIRHLARSLNDADPPTCYQQPKRLRLTYVKRLARALTCTQTAALEVEESPAPVKAEESKIQPQISDDGIHHMGS